MSDPCDASSSEQSTHEEILKSTLLVGASSIVGVAFSIIRNKAVALMLGPEGIGLMGLYSALADMAQNLAGMGVLVGRSSSAPALCPECGRLGRVHADDEEATVRHCPWCASVWIQRKDRA